jgi:hypothetical protein
MEAILMVGLVFQPLCPYASDYEKTVQENGTVSEPIFGMIKKKSPILRISETAACITL